MRGKHAHRLRLRRKAGLIPAHAGKTHPNHASKFGPRAHPRACGENQSTCLGFHPPGGSSPRMRGKLRCLAWFSPYVGLIPAHAGKTAPRLAGRRDERAHPRACGENDGLRALYSFSRGSSPRMRGKHRKSWALRLMVWLIPAHAGKTHLTHTRNPVYRAHPRACGENLR